jgi:N6-adenosine-specific RNA methylase IME4
VTGTGKDATWTLAKVEETEVPPAEPTKAERRSEREQALARRILALPDKKCGLIYDDCEWRFEPWSRETGMDRAADNHYPTSELLTLMQRDVASIAARDCILFHWATVPMLIEAICVADAWGFCLLNRDPSTGFLLPDKRQSRYVSNWAWFKQRIATCYWNRGKHELLLCFTRGNPVAPAMEQQLPSWFEGGAIEAPTTGHSVKPEVFIEWIEKLWPNSTRA